MEKKKRRSREASSSLPVTRPHLDPAGHSGMRKDILGVLLCQAWSHPAPIMPVIMEPPPECPWTHFTLEGRSRTELFVDATEAEFLLEFLGGPGPCCHLCVLSTLSIALQHHSAHSMNFLLTSKTSDPQKAGSVFVFPGPALVYLSESWKDRDETVRTVSFQHN